LIGAGLGATPLGDDILVGYLGTSKLLDIHYTPDVEETIQNNLKQTTKLSATSLFAANYGEIPETAVLLIKSFLCDENTESTLILAEKLCSIGQSTGQGLLMGMVTYLLNCPFPS